MRVLSFVARRPWRWVLVLLVPLVLFPRIDLAFSALFFDEVHRGFPFRSHPVGEFVRKTLPLILFALAGGVALLGVAAGVSRRRLAGVTPRIAVFVVASLALGPGLVVNAVLKDHWGRARPSTIAEFAGPNQAEILRYTPPLLPAGQCSDNCSFPSGHAALGFWLVTFALLAPPRWRRWSLAAALGVGAAVGLSRIAQGAHFLSDVAFSAAIVIGVARLLQGLIVAPEVKASRDSERNPG